MLDPAALLDKELRTRRVQEEARPVLRMVRERAAENLPEVQTLSHKLASALVIDQWDKAQAAKREEAALAKAADLAEAAKVAAGVRDGIMRDRAVAHERRLKFQEATLALRTQQEEEAERRALEEVRDSSI